MSIDQQSSISITIEYYNILLLDFFFFSIAKLYTHTLYNMTQSDTVELTIEGFLDLSNPEEFKNYIDRNKVFLREEAVTNETQIVIDYPLQDDFLFPLRPATSTLYKGCVSVGEIIDRIYELYHEIYNEENSTTTVTPGNIPGMLNRNTTNGKYGIWGHDLSDLVLTSVEFNAKDNIISLCVDS